jgi:hypothetical protein
LVESERIFVERKTNSIEVYTECLRQLTMAKDTMKNFITAVLNKVTDKISQFKLPVFNQGHVEVFPALYIRVIQPNSNQSFRKH